MPDQQDRRQRPHRPAPHPDLTDLIDAVHTPGDLGPEARADVAAATAAVVLAAGRGAATADQIDVERLINLGDVLGLDTLAALWRNAEPVSLPGALWILYVLRQWCLTNAEEVAVLWRAGEPYAQADAVVAGVGEYAGPDALRRFANDLLAGAYGGDFDVALERAAGFFRVVAAGRRDRIRPEDSEDSEDPVTGFEHAQRNDRAAADLAQAAARWREGTLS